MSALAGSYYTLPSKYRATASASFMLSAMGGLTVATFQIFGLVGASLKDMTYSSAFLDFGAFFVLDGKAWGVSCLGTTTATFAMTAVVFWMIPVCLVLLGCLSQLIPILKRNKLTWEWRKVISLIGNTLQTAFTTMTSLALVPFMCFKHPLGKYSVLKYPDIFCGSSEHTLMHWAGASLILLATAFVSFCAFGAVKAPALAANPTKRELEMFTFLLHRFRQLYLCILLWCMPWKAPLLNLADVTSTALLVALLGVFLSGAGFDTHTTDGLQLFVSSCIVGSLLLATLVAAVNFAHWIISERPLDPWCINLGRLPRGEDIFTALEDVADFIKDARAQKETVVMTLEQLSAYDIDSIMKSLSIMHDELQMETSSGNFGTRIAHSHRKITAVSRDSGAGKGDPATEPIDLPTAPPPGETGDTGDASRDVQSTAPDKASVEAPRMQEEMYDNPEGKQVIVSHLV